MQATLIKQDTCGVHTGYVVYILLCANGTYYTGYTTDLKRRYQEHLSGTAKCKYTRSFKPVSIAQYWKISGDKSHAMRVEAWIKKMNKPEKQQLIQSPERLYEQIKADKR